jgi:hypothetical protein
MDFKARTYRLLGSSCLSLMAPLLVAGTGCSAMNEDADVSSVEDVLIEAEEAVAESGACQVPGTLAYHMAQASAWGTFDYDPPGGLVERVRGRYRDYSGRFSWKEYMVDGSYVVNREVLGQATAFDTQQSLAYRVETTDTLGAVSVTEVEESWDGCTVERRFRPQGGSEADWRNHSGSYDGTTYTYFEQQAPYRNGHRLPIITVEGARGADQSFIEYFEGGGYPEYYQTRTGDGLGNEGLSWEINYGDGYIYGFVDTSASGTRHHFRHHFTRSLSDGDGCTETWSDATVAYDGHGSGSSQICDFSNDEFGQAVSCTLAITPEQCVETCANGAVNVRASCL